MASAGAKRLALVLMGITLLTACEEGADFKPFAKKTDTGTAPADVTAAETATVIERDVESPEVFQQNEAGLWDGRPSLGGVWVAHPDATNPERVIIRNEKNGNFVIGALFRRERENPGPRFQVSSDAASALGMLAGAPSVLNVTALIREEVTIAPEVTAPAVDTLETPEAVISSEATVTPEAIQETSLDDPVAAIAASAIEEATSASAPTTPAKTPEKAPTAIAPAEKAATATAAPLSAMKQQKSALDKPYIQIGIYNVEANANRTADMLRASGVIPLVKQSTTSGKKFWRVVVGPSGTKSAQSSVLKKVQKLGFPDAYAVTN